MRQFATRELVAHLVGMAKGMEHSESDVAADILGGTTRAGSDKRDLEIVGLDIGFAFCASESS